MSPFLTMLLTKHEPQRRVVSVSHGPIDRWMISPTYIRYDDGLTVIKFSQWARPTMGGIKPSSAPANDSPK